MIDEPLHVALVIINRLKVKLHTKPVFSQRLKEWSVIVLKVDERWVPSSGTNLKVEGLIVKRYKDF